MTMSDDDVGSAACAVDAVINLQLEGGRCSWSSSRGRDAKNGGIK